MGNYILDFYSPAERLAIELDGKHHFTEEGIQQDRIRDQYLRSVGIEVLRFENHLVLYELDRVMATIKANLKPAV